MNASLRRFWQGLNESFAARERRERFSLSVLTLTALTLAGFFFAIDPALTRARGADEQLAQRRGEAAEVQARLADLSRQIAADPNVLLRADLDSLRGETALLEQKLLAMEHSLVPPRRMNALLESILARQSGLRLVGLRTLPPTPVIERKTEVEVGAGAAAGKGATDAAALNLYRHGVEITLDGSYGDLLGYLAQLERAPEKLVWGELKLSVVDHPRCRMTLMVYTLSFDTTWLSL